jgi:type II secretion system protein N
MKSRLWLSVFVGISALILTVACFAVLVFSFIPNMQLQDSANRLLADHGFFFKAVHFKKSFPLGLQAKNLEFFSSKGLLLKAEKSRLHLQVWPLLLGRMVFVGEAAVGNGRIEGRFSSRNEEFCLDVADVKGEEVPLLETMTGARLKGTIRGQGCIRKKGLEAEGQWRLEVKEAAITGATIGGLALPDADQALIQTLIRLTGRSLRVDSFTIQREGLYVRLKGDLPLRSPIGLTPLNLSLELMPQPTFLEKQKLAFLLLTKYLITPGHYRIPIRGNLAQPSVP